MSLPRVDKVKRVSNAASINAWEAKLSKKYKGGLPGPPMMWIGLWGAAMKSFAVHRQKWEGTDEDIYRRQLEPEVYALLVAMESCGEALRTNAPIKYPLK